MRQGAHEPRPGLFGELEHAPRVVAREDERHDELAHGAPEAALAHFGVEVEAGREIVERDLLERGANLLAVVEHRTDFLDSGCGWILSDLVAFIVKSVRRQDFRRQRIYVDIAKFKIVRRLQ